MSAEYCLSNVLELLSCDESTASFLLFPMLNLYTLGLLDELHPVNETLRA